MRISCAAVVLVVACQNDKPASKIEASTPTVAAKPSGSIPAMSDQDLERMVRGLGTMPVDGGLAALAKRAKVQVTAPGASAPDTHEVLSMHDAMAACGGEAEAQGGKGGSVVLEVSVDATGQASAKGTNVVGLARSEVSCMEDRARDAHFSAGSARTVKVRVVHEAS